MKNMRIHEKSTSQPASQPAPKIGRGEEGEEGEGH